MEVGSPVKVLDAYLATLRSMGADINHHGWVHEIEEDGTVMVLFPIGNDDPQEHSQLAPYPPNMVEPRDGEKFILDERV